MIVKKEFKNKIVKTLDTMQEIFQEVYDYNKIISKITQVDDTMIIRLAICVNTYVDFLASLEWEDDV